MKIVSYNVNGIRAAISKGLLDWVEKENIDILCLQEIKANLEDIPTVSFEKLGYHSYIFSAEKKGYSGVAIFSKIPASNITYGMGNPLFDSEGRSIELHFSNFSIINTYFPSGTTGDIRQEVKYQFLEYYYNYIQKKLKLQPNLIVVGDYNIAHREADIHDPKGNKNSSGFLPEERAWMDKWFGSGMLDSFRILHPDAKDIYSWWTYRAGARQKNKGWRIDYISISEPLKKALKAANIHNEVVQSDHCPISILLNSNLI